jgi:hypothetical protein
VSPLGTEDEPARLNVRRAWVRNEMTTPKSKTSRRVLDLKRAGHVLGAFEEQWRASRYRADESLVFCHPALGTPLDSSKLGRDLDSRGAAGRRFTPVFRSTRVVFSSISRRNGSKPARGDTCDVDQTEHAARVLPIRGLVGGPEAILGEGLLPRLVR